MSRVAWLQCLEPQGRDLDVSVDVEAVILAGQHHAPVVHQRHVKTLSVLHLHEIVMINYLCWFAVKWNDCGLKILC